MKEREAAPLEKRGAVAWVEIQTPEGAQDKQETNSNMDDSSNCCYQQQWLSGVSY